MNSICYREDIFRMFILCYDSFHNVGVGGWCWWVLVVVVVVVVHNGWDKGSDTSSSISNVQVTKYFALRLG